MILPLLLTFYAIGEDVVSIDPAAAERGQRLAQAACGRCHAIGPKGDSPMADVPRFRDLSTFEPGRNLDEVFATGVLVSHAGMPHVLVNDRERSDLLAYVRSVQAKPPAAAR